MNNRKIGFRNNNDQWKMCHLKTLSWPQTKNENDRKEGAKTKNEIAKILFDCSEHVLALSDLIFVVR